LFPIDIYLIFSHRQYGVIVKNMKNYIR